VLQPTGAAIPVPQSNILSARPRRLSLALGRGREIQFGGCPLVSNAHSIALDLTIRIAHEEDLEWLVRLAAAFRDHVGQSTPSEAEFRTSIAALLQDVGTEFFLACDRPGAVLGYVQVRYRYSAWTSALEAELEDVFVVPEARRRGVGRRLVKFAIARATARGCRSMGLNTNERNVDALALYQQVGLRSERPRRQGGRQLWLTKSLEPP
jgi:ribosomal protein S18 acetylase RimI-like enzyme